MTIRAYLTRMPSLERLPHGPYAQTRARPWSSSVGASARHPDRITLAREFGATDVVSDRGPEATSRVKELTDGYGVDAVLECVGLDQSMLSTLRHHFLDVGE